MRRVTRMLIAVGCLLPYSAVPATALSAVEYFHAGYGHYFVTVLAQEIAELDAGRTPGWSRTGESFEVLEPGSAGSASVCRFWSAQSFAPKSSHFYTPLDTECAIVRNNRAWQFEGQVFGLMLADGAGSCPAGNVPLYRLYNGGASGAPNHRYTTKLATRAGMIAQGWIPEGSGIGVIGCVAAPSAPITVVAAGDIGQCFGGPASTSVAAKTAALIQTSDTLVLTLGDHAYDIGSPEEFAGCFDPTWGHFKDRIRPTPGNHDYYTPEAAGYFAYFGPLAGPGTRGYYSFDHGGWHFLSLNSLADASPTSEQYQWVAADLAASRNTLCTIAYWHYPAYNSGAVYGSITEMRPLFDLLQKNGVEILLSGHEHIYERFAPQNAFGGADPIRGLRQFVVGTGGHQLNPMGTPLPNSEFRDNGHWGVLRLSLGEGTYGWAFVPVGGGAPLDSGTGLCHP